MEVSRHCQEDSNAFFKQKLPCRAVAEDVVIEPGPATQLLRVPLGFVLHPDWTSGVGDVIVPPMTVPRTLLPQLFSLSDLGH